MVIPDAGPELTLFPGGQGRSLVIESDAATDAHSQHSTSFFRSCMAPMAKTERFKARSRLSDVAYVGSRVMGSAAAMDKDVAKRLMRDAGLPIVPFVAMSAVIADHYADAVGPSARRTSFVKPANMGSSVGVSKARTADDSNLLHTGPALRPQDLDRAVRRVGTGDRVLRAGGRERRYPRVSARRDRSGRKARVLFVRCKIHRCDGAALHFPANVPSAPGGAYQGARDRGVPAFCAAKEWRASTSFSAGEQIFVNEANTLPGFTNISMYPKLWEASRVSPSRFHGRADRPCTGAPWERRRTLNA